MFTVNGTTPTTIKYDGTDITVLKQGTTAVWGKPYALSINTGTGVASIKVNRTSSPNMHASTGNLSNGATIYHGDVLKITATPSTSYNLSTLKVNGISVSSGSSITVSGAVTVAATATYVQGWKTVWSGWKDYIQPEVSSTSGVISIPNIVAGRRTRVSGGNYFDSESFDYIELTQNITSYTLITTDYDIKCYLRYPSENGKLAYQMIGRGSSAMDYGFYLGLVEQYY